MGPIQHPPAGGRGVRRHLPARLLARDRASRGMSGREESGQWPVARERHTEPTIAHLSSLATRHSPPSETRTMTGPDSFLRRMLSALAIIAAVLAPVGRAAVGADEPERRLLYVATPGIRNYLEYGGHGLLVFD